MKKIVKIALFSLVIGINAPGLNLAMSPLAHLSKVGITATQHGLSSLIAPAAASSLTSKKRIYNTENSRTPQRNFGILETLVDLMCAGTETFVSSAVINGFFPNRPGSWLDTFAGLNNAPKKSKFDPKPKDPPKQLLPIEQVLANRRCAYISTQKEDAAIDQKLKLLEEQRKELEEKKNQIAQTLYFNSDY